MKTAAWETTPQIALRNCFKEVMEEGKTTAFMTFHGFQRSN